MIALPSWFKILLIVFGALFILSTIKVMLKDKYLAAIKDLPNEEKEKLLKQNLSLLKIYRVSLWLAPVAALIFYTSFLDIYGSENIYYFMILIIIMYIPLIQKYFYSRSIVLTLEEDIKKT